LTFRVRPLAQSDAEALAGWHYPEPYSFYDWTAFEEDLAELLDPTLRGDAYFAVEDEAGNLVGYFSFRRAESDTLVIGLGLHPDLTGQGLGASFVSAALDYGRENFGAKEFSLAVANFNARAITVYERAGFVKVRTYMHTTSRGDWEFLEMRRPA
jgi:ribosomal-protein-alanine N-acetyltransferase